MGMTYNAILENKEYKPGLFAKGPIASDGTVVFLSEREKADPLFTITTNNNPKMHDIRESNCGWQTVVDLSWHMVDVQIEAKAKDHVSKFLVNMKINTRVIDSLVIYQNWVMDMADYVKGILEGMVEEIAYTLDIRDDVILKRALGDKFKSLQLEGVEVNAKNITVDYDSETNVYLKELLNTERQKNLFIDKQKAAGEIGEGLNGEIGALIDILEGRLSASDIDNVRRILKKHERDDAFEEVEKKVKLLKDLLGDNMLSELVGQKAMEKLLVELGVVNQGHSQERESEVYAPPEEEGNS